MLTLPFIVTILAFVSAVVAGNEALPATFVGLLIGGGAGWQLEGEDTIRRLPDRRVWLRGE
jgi:hypothetical protein